MSISCSQILTYLDNMVFILRDAHDTCPLLVNVINLVVNVSCRNIANDKSF
jgi:hypothetical protein